MKKSSKKTCLSRGDPYAPAPTSRKMISKSGQPELDFSPPSRAFLERFYAMHNVRKGDNRGRIRAMREYGMKGRSLLAASGGIDDDVTELRALEFFYLIDNGRDE